MAAIPGEYSKEAYKKNNFVVLSSDYKKMIRDKKLRFYETK